MRKPENVTGQTFGALTAVSPIGRKNKRWQWLFRCECGGTVELEIHSAKQHPRLGCQRCRPGRARWDGIFGSKARYLYDAWKHMIQRCSVPHDSQFKNYGGRGIRVCDEWRANPRAFVEYMGPRPTPQHSIDRIDNDGNYEPGNCRWATRTEQSRNSRVNRHITFDGETRTFCEWAVIRGMPKSTFHRWVQALGAERALRIAYVPGARLARNTLA